MTDKIVENAGSIEWRQDSRKFAIADFRRNWDRWLLWTAVFVGSIAALTMIRGLNHHPKSASLNMAIFWPSLFLAVFGFKFLLALCCWRVKIGDGRLELSEGRNVRYYHLAKVARVTFQPLLDLCFLSSKPAGESRFFWEAKRRLIV